MTDLHTRSCNILYVDDNLGDVELVHEALDASGLPCELHVADSGDAAWSFLNREGDYSDKPYPDIILLDWNMPKQNGLEVLKRIKADSRFSRIPSIIFTSSERPKDVNDAYQYGANCYVAKPVDLDQFLSSVQQLFMFWIKVVTLSKTTGN